jgi:hypothetical protein
MNSSDRRLTQSLAPIVRFQHWRTMQAEQDYHASCLALRVEHEKSRDHQSQVDAQYAALAGSMGAEGLVVIARYRHASDVLEAEVQALRRQQERERTAEDEVEASRRGYAEAKRRDEILADTLRERQRGITASVERRFFQQQEDLWRIGYGEEG